MSVGARNVALTRGAVPVGPPIDYASLHELALQVLNRWRASRGMRATSLAHEAWLRLAHRATGTYASADQALAVSTRAMPSVLVDNARRQAAVKRGGGQERHDVAGMDGLAFEGGLPPAELLALDAALARLELLDARKSRVVELRFFGGLSVEESAAELGVSTPTVKRDWRLARAWLRRELSG